MRLARLSRLVTHLTNQFVHPLAQRLAKLAATGYHRVPSPVRRAISRTVTITWRVLRQLIVRPFRTCRWIWRVKFGRLAIAIALCATLGFGIFSFPPDLSSIVTSVNSSLTPSRVTNLKQSSTWGRFQPATNTYQTSVTATVEGSEYSPLLWKADDQGTGVQMLPPVEGTGSYNQDAIVTIPSRNTATISVTINDWRGTSGFAIVLTAPDPSPLGPPFVSVSSQLQGAGSVCQFSTSVQSADLGIMFVWHSNPDGLGYQAAPDTTDPELGNPTQLGSYSPVIWKLNRRTVYSVWADAYDLLNPRRPLGSSSRLILYCP